MTGLIGPDKGKDDDDDDDDDDETRTVFMHVCIMM
jgi:hypothetical protein